MRVFTTVEFQLESTCVATSWSGTPSARGLCLARRRPRGRLKIGEIRGVAESWQHLLAGFDWWGRIHGDPRPRVAVYSLPPRGYFIKVARELRSPVRSFAASRATISGTGRRHLYSPARESNIPLRVLLRARLVQTYVPHQSHFGTLRVTYGPTVFQCFQACATATLPQIPLKTE
jgi:hypothetical protein